MVLLLFEPFPETYEVLFKAKERFFLSVMGHDDDKLLDGTVSWHKVAEIELRDVLAGCKDVTVTKKFWSPGLRVAFNWSNFRDNLKINADIVIPEEKDIEIYRYLAEALKPVLEGSECSVEVASNKIQISLPTSVPSKSPAAVG